MAKDQEKDFSKEEKEQIRQLPTYQPSPPTPYDKATKDPAKK